jgi:hypothetical protein
MIGKVKCPNSLSFFIILIFLFISPHLLLSEDNKQPSDCLDQAIKRIIEIRSLPEIKYIETLDGQSVFLNEFYDKCLYLFPQCSLFTKFYYWQSEIREVVSNTESGSIKHKIRCYNDCFSSFCPDCCDPRKTHGDVAEFYDQRGNFMGIAVYMGDGKYCSLPLSGYKK